MRHEVPDPRDLRKWQAVILSGSFSPTCLHLRKGLLTYVEAELEIRG